MLGEILPNTTIVSIGHRSTLIALHRWHIEMARARMQVLGLLARR
jgi:ABC-type uncharacterized transport system fused permease/ATPase subunit